MNRAQRRKQQKAIPKHRRGLTREDRIKALLKNGISPDDLKKSFDDGWKAGWLAGAENMLETIYAAVIMSLKEHYGFGPIRCERALRTADQNVVTCIDKTELIEKAWESVGLRLNFENPFDRIERVR